MQEDFLVSQVSNRSQEGVHDGLLTGPVPSPVQEGGSTPRQDKGVPPDRTGGTPPKEDRAPPEEGRGVPSQTGYTAGGTAFLLTFMLAHA